MLIEFKMENFRSIRDEQTLSMVAQNVDKELTSSVIEHELPGLTGLHFLKGAAIYGANASGKSNIIQAFGYVTRLVRHSATKLEPGDETGAEPFKLDRESAGKPSKFEVTFVVDNVRYLFGLSLTRMRVIEEFLVAYPKGVPQRWYHRTFNPKKNDYDWEKPSTSFEHDKSLQKKTRANTLFLSVGPQFNHPQLTTVFNWFKNKVRFIHLDSDANLAPGFTAEMMEKEKYRSRILNLLKTADIGVADAQIQDKERQGTTYKKLEGGGPKSLVEEVAFSGLHELKRTVFSRLTMEEVNKSTKMEITLAHQIEGSDPIPLDFDNEESFGTRRFFSLIGPWIDLLEKGQTVFIDEIEASLHPLLVKELLKLLFCSTNNTTGAQVIFTTHNPVLLDGSLMRRDQFWFTEKTPAGTTSLYPLTDYKPRKEEALVRGYLSGRYGGIPFIPEGLKV